eukprot:1812240-Rhodomonas_salina.2
MDKALFMGHSYGSVMLSWSAAYALRVHAYRSAAYALTHIPIRIGHLSSYTCAYTCTVYAALLRLRHALLVSLLSVTYVSTRHGSPGQMPMPSAYTHTDQPPMRLHVSLYQYVTYAPLNICIHCIRGMWGTPTAPPCSPGQLPMYQSHMPLRTHQSPMHARQSPHL